MKYLKLASIFVAVSCAIIGIILMSNCSHKTFTCEECHEQFSSKEALDQHSLVQHSLMKCDFCNTWFNNQENLINHVIEKHPKCDKCGKRFENMEALELHKSDMYKAKLRSEQEQGKEKTQKVYQCAYCDFTTTDPDEYNRHRLESPQYKCKICSRKEKTKIFWHTEAGLDKHMREQHSDQTVR